MRAPLEVSLSGDGTRAAFRLVHPKGNIITADMIAALRQALDPLTESASLKLVTIEGAGLDFSFGASIPEHAPGEINRVLPDMHALVHALLAEDIVDAMGARQPSVSNSARVHRQAFIYVLSNGRTLDQAQVDKVDRIRRAWATFFRDGTNSRMTAETRLRP